MRKGQTCREAGAEREAASNLWKGSGVFLTFSTLRGEVVPMVIQIDNPEIEYFFVNEFKSDIKRFSEFILTHLTREKKQNGFAITPLDPREHAYKLDFDDVDEIDESANPFREIDDVVEYAKKLRENAWR